MGDLDSAAKVLLRSVPGSLLARFLPGFRLAPGRSRGAPVELVWQKRAVDHVVEVARGRARAALHMEVAATPEPDVPARCLLYNAGLRVVGHRRVVSIVIYLRPGKRRGHVKDELEDEGAGVSPLTFSFEAIRLWQEDASRILGGDAGFLPFLPYARGCTSELVAQGLRRLRRRVRSPTRQADLMAVLATFANDRFPDVEWFAMIPKEIQMRSRFLQELEARGEARGKREVLQLWLEMSLGAEARQFARPLESASPKQLEQLTRLLTEHLSGEQLLTHLRRLFPRRPGNGRKTASGLRRRSARS